MSTPTARGVQDRNPVGVQVGAAEAAPRAPQEKREREVLVNREMVASEEVSLTA